MTFKTLQSRSFLAWPVYGLCAFLPLSIAGIGVFKLLSLLTGLVVLLAALFQGKRLLALRTGPSMLALTLLGALAVSLTYTSVPLPEALGVLTKYGKLLLFPAVALLIRSREQALAAIGIYVVTQSFVLLTSWLLFLGLHLPWVPAVTNGIGVVYSSYLDQAIFTAGLAAIAWHLRRDFPTRYGPGIAIALSVLAVLNLLFVLTGRSGQVCLIAAVAITVWWAMPRKLRPFAVLAPFVAFGLAMLLSAQFNQRYKAVFSEVNAYQSQTMGYKETSSGERLNYWRKSLQAMAERPVLGYGVGSWQQQYHRMESGKPTPATFGARNPHQEYLFWGVQLGAVGIVLLVAWMLSMFIEARKFETSVMRATVSLLVVFAVASALNSALYDGLVGDYFCALLAVLLTLGRYSPPHLFRASA
jgi:O-antigen ligase